MWRPKDAVRTFDALHIFDRRRAKTALHWPRCKSVVELFSARLLLSCMCPASVSLHVTSDRLAGHLCFVSTLIPAVRLDTWLGPIRRLLHVPFARMGVVALSFVAGPSELDCTGHVGEPKTGNTHAPVFSQTRMSVTASFVCVQMMGVQCCFFNFACL